MNSLFHKLIMLKATEAFACLHRWYCCSKGLERLRWAETKLHAVGRPPKDTSAQRLSVKVGGFFVQTLKLTVNSGKRVTREILSFAVIWNLFLVFSSESYLSFTVSCFSGVLPERRAACNSLIFRETRSFLFCFLSVE